MTASRAVAGPRPPARLRHARLAVLGYFVVLGVSNGDWLARIPAIKHGLHMSDGMLGLALLATPAGLVTIAILAGRVIDRFGSRRPTALTGFVVALVPISTGVVPNEALLMVCLFCLGLAGGLLDVAMNSQAVHVERGYVRPLMTSFHAVYSFGALGGGLVGGVFASAAVRPAVNFAVVGAAMVALALAAAPWLIVDGRESRTAIPTASPTGGSASVAAPDTPSERPAVGSARRRRLPAWRMSPLLVLSILALCSLLGEGAADGWSAVYLHDNLGASAGLAALGYASFAFTMAFGRLAGDWLALRLGPATLLRAGGVTAAIGMIGALASPGTIGAMVGFAVYGAGLSCTFPQLVSLAGNILPDRPASAIARVAGFGYVGMLGGPVLIGGIASAAGLAVALGLPALLALGIAAGARFGASAAAAPKNTTIQPTLSSQSEAGELLLVAEAAMGIRYATGSLLGLPGPSNALGDAPPAQFG